jgi:hypothetical protein
MTSSRPAARRALRAALLAPVLAAGLAGAPALAAEVTVPVAAFDMPALHTAIPPATQCPASAPYLTHDAYTAGVPRGVEVRTTAPAPASPGNVHANMWTAYHLQDPTPGNELRFFSGGLTRTGDGFREITNWNLHTVRVEVVLHCSPDPADGYFLNRMIPRGASYPS